MYFLDADSNEIMHKTLVITSNDITHDISALSAFPKAVISHLKNQCNISLQHLIERSDRCESQYEDVHAFKQIVIEAHGANIQITAAFFGSEHGKGESDDETGVRKTKLQNHILGSGGVIKNAQTFGDVFLSETSESHNIPGC